MIPICPTNQSLSYPWTDDGINRCFVYTIYSSILSSISIIPCFCQIIFYRKYGHSVDSNIRSKSKLYYFLILLHILAACLPFIHAIVYEFIVAPEDEYGNKSYGFIIITGILPPISWIFILVTLLIENSMALPSTPSRGHGLILLCSWLANFILLNLPLVSLRSPEWWWRLNSSSDYAEFVIWLLEYLVALFIFLIAVKAPALPNYNLHYNRLNAESAEPTSSNNLKLYWNRFKFILPYIWPKSSCLLQFHVLACITLLVIGRATNLYTPIFYKRVVDSLTPVNASLTLKEGRVTINNWTHYQVMNGLCLSNLIFHWDLVLIYVALRTFQGLGAMGSGIIGGMRNQLWIAVDQFSTREVAVALFKHVHGLSLNWHLSRKTGEVLRVVDRGTSSISNILNYLVFNILPTIADIIIGVIYFISAFNIWYGLIVFITMVSYLVATVLITSWRTKYRKEMNKLQNEVEAIAVDSLLNFETVKYYNAEDWETERYRGATLKYQHSYWKTQTSLNLLNNVQNIIISIGLLVGTILCARDVVSGKLVVGDFVLFCTYIIQLYLPLNLFGTYYRMLQTSFVDMENMFELFEQGYDVTDAPSSRVLTEKQGKVEFKNVSFGYDSERKILKNVSFIVNPGQTIALVGQTGSGKSTILRLLFRFFDVNEGQILVDDQDIKTVTQHSLRRSIGVVPQDTILFNSDIMFNIRYGRQTASDEDVREAAKMADIHDRILEYPQQYNTIVGERGLKLSGGEKQRVAIARTILKAPRIVLLDEATSALDTETERNIQASLNKMSANKTTIVVAHRLSTVINADIILVVHRGEIVERGNYTELLELGGRFAKLWHKQTEAIKMGVDEVPFSDDEQNENDLNNPSESSNNNSNREISFSHDQGNNKNPRF